MNHLIHAFILCLLMLFANLPGQGGAGTSGGEGETGMYKVSYSIGQCFYTATSQSALYISSGIQHPFMLISIETDVQEEDADPGLEAYPNPVKDRLRLKIEDPEMKELTYNLLDVSGKILQVRKIDEREMVIPMTDLTAGIYFLNIYCETGILKTFKLIKH